MKSLTCCKDFFNGGKMHMKKKNIILLITLFTVGCKVNVGTNESEQFKVIPITGAVDFKALSTYVLNPSCLRCHSWASDEASVQQRIMSGDPENSILYQKIKSGSMPPSGALPTRQLELVERYIKTAKTAPTIEINSTFKSINFHLIGKSCLSCHNNTTKEMSFEGYANVKKHASEIIDILDIGDSEGTPMPPVDSTGRRKAPVPTQQIVEAFRTWMAEGAQNN